MFIDEKRNEVFLVHGKRIPAKLDDVTPLRLDVKIDDSIFKAKRLKILKSKNQSSPEW